MNSFDFVDVWRRFFFFLFFFGFPGLSKTSKGWDNQSRNKKTIGDGAIRLENLNSNRWWRKRTESRVVVVVVGAIRRE